ncbi:Predicted GTPase [Desulfonatronum thiosulfatophilum]|uniref:Predicted GTPase n=1 Tax=Desulfonatronum thiosulfatophilum TaxID=617002 RepID=A0A1G6BYR9_9BACT|nr:GTPase [Desulfonatronum thiosulfatophilum]SDB25727.1 Predicted GTPase [Desulfonatronum thiosulfatophilum]
MEHQAVSEQILARVQNLIRKARRLERLPEAQVMALRLERVLNMLKHGQAGAQRPVCIVLLGGTGVGKSELFNALLGGAGLSPTSASIRPKTMHAYVAISPSDRQFFPEIDGAELIFKEHRLPGVALIDAPDVDSVEALHLDRTRKLIEIADIVVHVGSPDKRANFRINDEVRRWSLRKRWFFVLNKMDQIAELDREAVIGDFLERLHELGFDVDQGAFFALSAIEPRTVQFERFQNALFSYRAIEQIHALRLEDSYSLIRFALAGDVVKSIENFREQLLAHEQTLNNQVREVFSQVVHAAQSQDMLRRIIREQAWRSASGRVGGFLALPVWMRSRMAFSGLAYQLARMSTGGPSLGRMIRAGWHAAKAAWQGILPMQTLLKGFTSDQERRLLEIGRDAERILQDMGLDQLHGREPDPAQDQVGRLGDEEQAVWAARFLRLLRSQGVIGPIRPSEDVRTREMFQERLEEAVVVSASNMVYTRLGMLHTLAGNLLPVLVFGHAAFRLVSGWIEGAWLPFDFYLTAVAVFLISLVPGYLLVSFSLTRRTDMPETDTLVRAIENPSETSGLRHVRMSLEELLQETQALLDVLRIRTDVMRQELDPSRFGVTIRHQE